MKTLNDMLQKATQLSKREMKNVKGGENANAEWSCTCADGVGQWTANYQTDEQIFKALREYCSEHGGGSCGQ